MPDFLALIENEDVSIYRVPSESTEGDRVSLLMLQNAIKSKFGQYRYLEVGSHIGGMLIPHLCDPLCIDILSVDKRPLKQYDSRGRSFEYSGNSTFRMIETIKEYFPSLSLDKLKTIESDIGEVKKDTIAGKFDLLMIDAEHTNLAAVSDFLNLLKFCHDDSVLLFHDANIVHEAVLICEKILEYLHKSSKVLFLDDNVAAILLGSSMELAPRLDRRAQDRAKYIDSSRRYLSAQIATNNSK